MFMHQLWYKIKKFIIRMMGGLHLPQKLQTTEEKIVLHISDTPDSIYPFLLELIDELKPDVIIHTGDVADNIKLGLGLSEELYAAKVTDFLSELEARDWATTYIVPGNHDSVPILKEKTDNIILQEEETIIEVEGVNIGVAHYIENLPPRAAINLYGHNKKTFQARDKLFLNGILSINIILLPSGQHFQIPYPWKTKTGRQYKRLKLP